MVESGDLQLRHSTSSVLMVTRELSGDRRYGLGRSLAPVVDALTKQGWKVRYLCQEDLPTSALERRRNWLERLSRIPGIKGLPSRQLLVSALYERVQMGWFAAKTARDECYSVVHLHDPWMALGFWWGLKTLRLTHIRWGLTEHGYGCYSRATHEDGLTQGPRAQRWLRRLEAAVLNAAHWVVAPTRMALEAAARDLALPHMPKHWQTIPHAHTQPAKAPTPSHARNALGWPENSVHILGVGRLVPLKRFDILVEACAIVAHRHPSLNVQLHILGEGDQQSLQQLANTLGFGGQLHILAVDDVQPYYAASDIYVSTSTTESFGLANYEAMHAGLPCVCTSVGGVPEVMGVGAWLIPVDREAVVRALDELITSPTARQSLSARATMQTLDTPGPDTIAGRYAQLFLP